LARRQLWFIVTIAGAASLCFAKSLLLTTGSLSTADYAEYMVAPAEALARVPDELSAVDGAPLMCAGAA